MALSDHEETQLRLMEQTFQATDPSLVASFKTEMVPSETKARHRRRQQSPKQNAWRLLRFTAGLIGLVAGVAMQSVIVGTLGFLLMLAAVSTLRNNSTGDHPHYEDEKPKEADQTFPTQ